MANVLNVDNFLLQTVFSCNSTWSTITTSIPCDSSKPQNTEGTEILSLSITPKSGTSLLEIRCYITGYASNDQEKYTIALFQDSTADAICAVPTFTNWSNVNNGYNCNTLRYLMTSGTTSSTTFKIRIGNNGLSGLWVINGKSSGRSYGGIQKCCLFINEYST